MSLELIVFDWDGTLMDSEARIVACIQAAFSDVGATPPSYEVSRSIIGLGLTEAMRVLYPEGGDAQRESLATRYRWHFLNANQTPSPLFAGVRELLDWLRAENYFLAVATGKSRRGLNVALDDTGLGEVFHATRCADEAFSKPHPEMLLQIMQELGVKGEHTLMVGDTEYDMQMAKNAGAKALAACYGVHERDRLLEHRPLGCLRSLREMRPWLERGAAL
jgi:phosphoglycolate phosphatase